MYQLAPGAWAFIARLSTMSSQDEVKTFFALPKTTCVNILRFFSDLPHRRDWVLHLSSGVLVDVAHKNHPLRDAALEAVTDLFLHSSEDEHTISKIFETYGARCSSLSLNGELEHDFSQNGSPCTCLKNLNVRYSIRNVDDALTSLVSMQRNLEELELRRLGTVAIEGESTWEGLQREQRNYTKLSKLLMHFGGGLKRLDMPIFMAEDAAYFSMFRVLGSTLQSLKLSIRDGVGEGIGEPVCARFDLQSLANLCPNVTELEISGAISKSVRKEATNAYCAYGKKLKRIHISGNPRTENLLQIVSACTNAAFDMFLMSPSTIDCIHIVGHAIRSLNFTQPESWSWCADKVAAATSRCCNVESLEIRARLSVVTEFFRVPKPKLAKLELCVRASTAELSTLVGRIAESTHCLRYLSFTGPWIEKEALQKLVDANRNIESAVFLDRPDHGENAAEDEALYVKHIAGCVSVFSKSAALRHWSFYGLGLPQSSYAAIADASVSLRIRNVSVSHNTTEYL